MANRRDETLAVLQQLGLTRDEAEEEISYREAEAERLLDEAAETERAEAARQARAHLFATTPFYIVPRHRPVASNAAVVSRPTTPLSTPTAQPAASAPVEPSRPFAASSVTASAPTGFAEQSADVSTSEPDLAPPTGTDVAAATDATPPAAGSPAIEKTTPAVTNALRSMAIAVASSKRVIAPPPHANGNGSAVPPKPGEPLGLRLPRTQASPVQNGGLRPRVETPVVEPLPLEPPAPPEAAAGAPASNEVPKDAVEANAPPADITEIATPALPEVAILPPPTTMTANGNSSETGAAAQAEARPSSAPSDGVAEPAVADESSIAASTNGHTPASSPDADAPTAPDLEAIATGASTTNEVAAAAPESSETDSLQPAVEATSPPTNVQTEPVSELPLAAAVVVPDAATTVMLPGQKPTRLTRKKRRELAAAEAALAAANNPQPGSKPGGLLGPLKRYGRWAANGPKWHLAAGFVAPLAVVVLVAVAAFGQTQGWYSSTATPTKASDAHSSDPALSNKAYTNYVLTMDATLNSYGASIDTINRIATQPLSNNPGWATQLNSAAVAIEDAGQNLRKVGVPLCVANSHHTLMVGVTNMDNAADNLIVGLRNSNPDNLTTSASLINSAKPLLQQAAGEIKATKC